MTLAIDETLRPSKIHQVGSWAMLFLYHAFIGIIVASIAFVFVAAIADSIIKKYPLLKPIVDAGGAFNPIMWGPGFLIGLLVIRHLRHSAACWVWIVGAIWIALGIHDSLRYYHLYPQYYGTCSAWDNTRNEFFLMDSSKCRGGGQVLYGVFFTLPAISALGYSIGAWIALRFSKEGVQSS